MAGPVRIAILASGSQARRELAGVEGALGRLGNAGAKAAKLGFGALAVGAGAAAVSAVNTEKQFSTSMRLIQANTKASSQEMARLNDLAIRLGADTSFSAGEAADAMLELAKAGIDTKTIMGGGLAGTLQLAAAGGTDLATASTIASNALNTFNLAGSDMASISAALAGGANASTASVESLGMALQQVGPGATNAGLSLQETVAALSAFDAAGIKGSDAGTSLKTMLARLVPTSKQAATAMDQLGLDFVKGNGQFESLANIAGQLRSKLGGLTQAQRTQALTTIFGSDASRAATVLMNEGTAGIRKFIKATNDQDAAEKAAQARMSGTEGALERLSGAVETAQLRLGQELAPAITKGADLLGDKLVPGMENAITAGKKLANAVAPAASEIAEALGHLADQGDAAGSIFEDVLLPTLKTTAEVVGGVVNFIDELPGPVKSVGVQVGIAALVFPRFTAGVTSATTAIGFNIARLKQLQAEMTYTATRTQLTSGAMARMGAAAKTAAGVGGMVAMTQATQQTNESMSRLMMVGGATAVGFSVGGPWGAAIGAAGSSLALLAKNGWKSADAVGASASYAESSTVKWQDYAATLDQVTGAIGRQTRQEASRRLQEAGALDLARQLGIATQDVVKASVGNEAALARVQARVTELTGVQGVQVDSMGRVTVQSTALSTEAGKLAGILGFEAKAIAGATTNIQQQAIASGDLNRALKGVTDRGVVVARVEAQGWPQAAADVERLLSGIRLTPDQIKIAVKALGLGSTIGDVDKFAAKLSKVNDTKVTLGDWTKGIQAAIKKGASVTDAEKKLIVAKLNEIGKAQPDLEPLVRSVRKSVRNAKTEADASTKVGDQLKQGMLNGLAGTGAALSTIMSQAVRDAIAAARKAGDIKSPSRETDYLGQMLGRGLVNGMDATAPAVTVAGRLLGRAAVTGITDGSSGVDPFLGSITQQVEKKIKGKNQDKREKAVLKSLKDQFAQLRANGAEQDRINDLLGERVEKEQSAYDQLRAAQQAYRDYASGISSAIRATGDLTQLGRQEDGSVSLTSLFNELDSKAIRAERFQSLMTQLADDGLSREQVDQMLTAGPEAALATAEAIAAGGDEAITRLNQLQGRLITAGGVLGENMAARYYQTGIDAAQGLVAGLESQLAAVQAAAAAIAAALTSTVKVKLKVKSPSRVFMGIGENVMQGLDIGIDDTVASRAGARVADSLTMGFGNPALDAVAYWSSSGSRNRPTLRLEISTPTISQMQRGITAIKDIDFARSNGAQPETF